MVQKPTKRNYRQHYKEYFGIEFDNSFAVHHIDKNRNNNDISNLILLPKSLHSKFHLTSSFYQQGYILFNPTLQYISPSGLTYEQDMFKHYVECFAEIQKWLYYKETRYACLNNVCGLTYKKWD